MGEHGPGPSPAKRLDAPPVQTVDAWLWVSEFDELLAMSGRRSGVDVRGPALGEPTRCLLFPNPYLAEQMGSFAFRKQLRLQRSLSKPSLVLDVDNDAVRVTDPNTDALSASASRAQVTATPANFQPDGVTSGDGSTHDYPAITGLVVCVPGVQPLTIGCLDMKGLEFRFSWRGNVPRPNERPAYVTSGADLRALAETFGLTSDLEDTAAPTALVINLIVLTRHKPPDVSNHTAQPGSGEQSVRARSLRTLTTNR